MSNTKIIYDENGVYVLFCSLYEYHIKLAAGVARSSYNSQNKIHTRHFITYYYYPKMPKSLTSGEADV